MLLQTHIDDYANYQRRILLITAEPPLRVLISGFLVTMGCACAMVSSHDIDAIIERETFDAVLFDTGGSEVAVEGVLQKINQNRPGLAGRVLLIRRVVTDAQSIDLMDRRNLETSVTIPIQQLWAILQELFASSIPRSVPRKTRTGLMIFDSSRSPWTAGVRGARPDSRRLAYQHENATIDVLIEPVEASGRTLITGQILRQDGSSGESQGIPVLLVCGTRTVARTSSNRFGEFSLECEAIEKGCIEMRLGEGDWIALPLEKLNWVE